MASDAARYFNQLRVHLHLDASVESDVMRELADHVEDRVGALVRRGVPEDRARRKVLEGFGRPKTFAHLVRQSQLITSFAEATIGGAAFALVALVVGLQLWAWPAVAAAFAFTVVGVTLYGLWLGRPAWFYPWAGVALTMPVVAGYIAFAVLVRSAPELSLTMRGAIPLAGVAGASLYFPLGLLVLGAAVLVAVRRDWLDASLLLSPLPAALVWVIEVHGAGGLRSAASGLNAPSALLGAVFLCMALATVAYLRAGTRNAKFTLLIGSAIVLASATSMLIDPNAGLLMLGTRGVLLVGFLLSPALVSRHA